MRRAGQLVLDLRARPVDGHASYARIGRPRRLPVLLPIRQPGGNTCLVCPPLPREFFFMCIVCVRDVFVCGFGRDCIHFCFVFFVLAAEMCQRSGGITLNCLFRKGPKGLVFFNLGCQGLPFRAWSAARLLRNNLAAGGAEILVSIVPHLRSK